MQDWNVNTLYNFYQLYFDEQSERNCFDFAEKVEVGFTKWFENAYIPDLVKKSQSEYVGIFSHKFLRSPEKGRAYNFSKDELEKMLSRGYDVVSFFAHHKNQRFFSGNQQAHFDSCFDEMCAFYDWHYSSRIKPRFIIMQNAFFARKDVYVHYLTYLYQAMNFLNRHEGANKKCNYKSGLHYTFIPFLLEKMPSLFFHLHKEYKCVHWNDVYFKKS